MKPACAQERRQTSGEAAGYIAGILISILRSLMPLRMWLTFLASAALLWMVFESGEAVQIARSLCVYLVLISLVVGSVCRKR